MSTGGGHGSGAGERAALFAKRSEMNLDTMRYYAAALCGLMAVLGLFHITRDGPQKTAFPAASRLVRRALLPKFPGLPSRAHAMIIFLFVGINVAVLFTNMDNESLPIQTNIGARTGWLAMGNMVLTVMLALKNNPLTLISAWSYERLNILHQAAGYVTVVHVILHACTYAAYFGEIHNLKRLRTNEEIFGMVSGFGMLCLALTIVLRRFSYELFYVLHVFFFIVTVVFVGLHEPEVVKRVAIVTCIAGSLWALDRFWRLIRLVFWSFNNEVTIEPLPNGATRVRLKKSPRGHASGSHCFLWIPRVRLFETHPFTLIGDRKHEFVIASCNGFTRRLGKLAAEQPGKKLGASLEGPHGKFPYACMFDRVVMIAGGSGASYTVGTALNLIGTWSDGRRISFHWIVRDRTYFAWFAKFLTTLNATGKVRIYLHVTRPPSRPSRPVTSESQEPIARHGSPHARCPTPPRPSAVPLDLEKSGPVPANFPFGSHVEITTMPQPNDYATGHEPDNTAPHCDGTCGAHEICTMRRVGIYGGRPNVGNIIGGEVAKASRGERVLVLGCGPPGLMTVVRNETARCIKADGPGVELHTEQFSW